MLIDVHAHLDYEQFDPDRDAVMERAKKEDILVISSALGVSGIEKTLLLLDKYDNLNASFGLQPTELDSSKVDAVIDLIKKYSNRIVAIGEVGLDYYWVKDAGKRKQEEVYFRRFIELSDDLNLPLVIHSREAEDDAVKLLREYGKTALLHCFGGSVEQAEKASCDGHIISIPTNVVNSKQKQEVVKAVPLDSLVLETDAPYLAPVPKTRNEPVNIRLSAAKIAELKGVDVSAVADSTTATAKRFFDIK